MWRDFPAVEVIMSPLYPTIASQTNRHMFTSTLMALG